MQFYSKKDYFAFLSTPLGGLQTMYAVHHRLIGKRIVDFALEII